MSDSRFNVYDFFAYIIPGYLVAFGPMAWIGFSGRITEVLHAIEPYKYVFSVGSILGAYAIGHLVSEVASLVEERLLVARWLGYPSQNFFAMPLRRPLLFSEYRRGYDDNFAEDWKKTYEAVFHRPFDHRAAFLDAFHTVKGVSAPARQRLEVFTSAYGFCRNLAMALVLIVPPFVALSLQAHDPRMLLGGLGSLMAAFVFFARYLKFYRHFADEVFRSFYVLQKMKP